MRKIRLTVSYDGKEFCGWQRQINGDSIESVVLQALQKVHQTKIKVWAAGRTDSGVHAHAQVLHFHTPLTLPVAKFCEALNAHLPHSIRITASQRADDHFHARHSAVNRTYRYRILNHQHAPAQAYRCSWYIRQPLSLKQLNQVMRVVIGEHDFTTFAASGAQTAHCIRRIYAASFFSEGYFTTLHMQGNAFLWHMVRSLVGTAVELVSRNETEKMAELLRACDRRLVGQSAPARGLTLVGVNY